MEKFRFPIPYRGNKRAGLWAMLVVCVSALMAGMPAYGQAAASINLNVNDMPLSEVLGQIERQSGYRFVYSNELLRGKAPVTIALRETNIAGVMEALLPSRRLAYEIRADKTVLVKAAEPQQQAPGVTVTGTVYDQNDQPLVGAAVVALADGRMFTGVSTDAEGRFSIDVTGQATHLRISYVSYVTTTLPIDRIGRHMTVRLEESATVIDQVVATGYQQVRRERMTGSVATITDLEIEGRGYTSIEQVLMGTVAGLNMVQTGRPGADAQIQIRGINSLTGSTEPIWIVDGMPMQGEIPNITVGATDLQTTIFTTGIGNLAPDDIKSITVLKDASATAIYGARAANGVIVVETRSGTVGKTRFGASVNFGLTERPRNNIDMMTTAEKIEFERQIFSDQFSFLFAPGRVTALLMQQYNLRITPEQAQSEIARLGSIETDWFREIFRPALSQQYNFNMSGGSENTQHYASLNYTRERGTVPNNTNDRLGMNIKLTHSPSDKVLITGGLSATMRNDRATASVVDPLEYAMYANPYERLRNDDGSYAWDQTWDTGLSIRRPGLRYEQFNIVDDLERNTNRSRYLDAELSLKVEWEISRGLMFTSSGVYNANSNNNSVEIGAGSYTDMHKNWFAKHTSELKPEQLRGSLREATGHSSGYTWRNTLQYSRGFDGRHFVTLFGGQEIYNRTSYNSFDFSPIYDGEHRIVGFPDMTGIDGSVIDFNALGGTGKRVDKLSSFFANASYSYMDRYVFTAAVRYDGSDIIGNNNQFTPLWNVGARWNLHRERFIENINWIDLLSLRAGFGYTGSIDKNALPFTVLDYDKSLLYDGQTVPTSLRYPNPNVRWQTKQDFNVGIEMALLDNRLEIGANYYRNITRDVLDNHDLPNSSGRDRSIENVADLHNSGVEVELGATLVRRGSFRWYARANVAVNRNIVRNTLYKSPGDLPRLTAAAAHQFVEGHDASGWYGYRFAGVNPVNGAILVYTGNDGATLDMVETGVGLPTPQLYYLGRRTPPVVGGFMTTVTLDKFLLTANFEFKAGHKIQSFTTFKPLSARNRHSLDTDRWRQAGDVTNVPALSQQNVSPDMTAMMNYSYDNRLERGDYLRCSMVTLGYNFDPKLLSAIGFRTARVSLSSANLFTLSKYRGIDPALMGEFGYPNSRKFTFTLNLGF